MKNKSGFSLVELIIVIAIMGVVMGIGAAGFNMLTHQNARTANKDIYNMLGSAKNVAMSKGNCLFVIGADTDNSVGVYVLYGNKTDGYSVLQESSVGKKATVSYISDGATYYVSSNANDSEHTYSLGLVLDIDRATGKFNGAYRYSGSLTQPIADGATVFTCTDICVGQGSYIYDIGLVAATGKYYYK